MSNFFKQCLGRIKNPSGSGWIQCPEDSLEGGLACTGHDPRGRSSISGPVLQNLPPSKSGLKRENSRSEYKVDSKPGSSTKGS